MHIVLVNRSYPPDTGFGGIAVYNYYLSRALVKAGHRVTVITARASTDFLKNELRDGIEIRRILARNLPFVRRIPLLKRFVRPLQQWLYSREVSKLLQNMEKSDRLDIVEFADVEAEGYCYLRRKKRIPTVVRCHTPTFVLRQYYQPAEIPYNTSFVTAMEKYCIRNADFLSAPSHDMVKIIGRECGIPPQKICVIPNALDASLFSGERKKPQDNSLTVLHVGRLQRAKGVEVFAHAIPAVLENAPNTRFVFIGGDYPDSRMGTWKNRLQDFLRKKNALDRVEFIGDTSLETLLNWYKRSDIAIVPSLIYESFSYTCAEAMAAGLPVVASRIGGIPETVQDGVCGILVEPGNVSEIAAAVLKLIHNQELRETMGIAAMKRAGDFFDAHKTARQFLSIIENGKG